VEIRKLSLKLCDLVVCFLVFLRKPLLFDQLDEDRWNSVGSVERSVELDSGLWWSAHDRVWGFGRRRVWVGLLDFYM
jgi:hypothetical protein